MRPRRRGPGGSLLGVGGGVPVARSGPARGWFVLPALLPALLLVAVCSDATGVDGGRDEEAPVGADVATPFPIDRGDDGVSTPGTYKGLWLRLVDNGDPSGVTAVDGVIGIVCVGMSNARQECDAYRFGVEQFWAAEIDGAIRVANCAVGGHAIERWIDPSYDDRLWDDCRNRKLEQAGIRPDQVRVIYHKAADQFTLGPGGALLPTYPGAGSDYEAFVANLSSFAARVPDEFPSVRAVYTSSRSYGGFANNPGRGEPLSYEEGHALNTWLTLNRDVDGVWYGWGAYLWAPDCSSGETNGGGVCYTRNDYVTDGVHPSELGEAKIALLMHGRLRQEDWYRR